MLVLLFSPLLCLWGKKVVHTFILRFLQTSHARETFFRCIMGSILGRPLGLGIFSVIIVCDTKCGLCYVRFPKSNLCVFFCLLPHKKAQWRCFQKSTVMTQRTNREIGLFSEAIFTFLV